MAKLVEVGRVISAANETRLKAAMKIVEEVIASIGHPEPDPPANDEDMMTEATVKDGDGFTAADYAYTPNPKAPGSWKLRLTKTPGGAPDPVTVGTAVATLVDNNKAGVPDTDLPTVKAAVRAAWKKANPDKAEDGMPDGIKESAAEFTLDYIPLVEKAVYPDGTMPIKIIRPGWGSSGYYSEEVLKRDGPKVFTKGTQMFADHATQAEEAERPEGSIKDLVASFVNDAYYDSTGPIGLDGKPAGPGLYANARVVEHWRPFVQELAPHTGLSIRASGVASQGEAEGRKGPIIEGIFARKSVDLVTAPGAGGQILNLFESARSATATGGQEMSELQEAVAAKTAAETALTEAQTKIKDLETSNARLLEGEILREATRFIEESLPTTVEGVAPAVWTLTRTRLADSLGSKVVIKDKAIDKPAFKEAIDAAVKNELDYLAKLTESGTVKDMGGGGGTAGDKSALVESFKRAGLSEEEAKTAAEGR